MFFAIERLKHLNVHTRISEKSNNFKPSESTIYFLPFLEKGQDSSNFINLDPFWDFVFMAKGLLILLNSFQRNNSSFCDSLVCLYFIHLAEFNYVFLHLLLDIISSCSYEDFKCNVIIKESVSFFDIGM